MTEIEDLPAVHRIGGSGRGGGVPTVVWAFVAVLVAVVGFAVLGGQESGPPAADGEAAAGSGSPAASPTRTPRPTRQPRSPTPPPFLPPVPNMNLVGAPRVVLARRAGDDLELRTWRPGQAVFQAEEPMAGVFTGLPNDSAVWMDVSPDRRHGAITLQEFDADGMPSSASVRVVGSGRPAWNSGALPYGPHLLWSPDGTTLVIGGGPDWILLRLEPDGETSSTTIRVAAEPGLSPSPSPTPDPLTPDFFVPRHPLPFAFSADGRSLYGATVHDSRPTFRPAIRVALDALGTTGPTVSPIDRLPVGGPDGLAPTGYPGDAVDPLTGRMLEVVYDGSAPRLEIYEPGGDTRVEIDDLPLDIGGAVWAGDGRLLVVTSQPHDASREIMSVDVRWIEPDGTLGPVVLTAERVNGGGPWLGRPGWVLLSFSADEALLFVLLRTSDGATATVRLRQDDLADLVAIDLVDPLPPR